MKHFESKYCDIIWDEKSNVVITQWKGYATSEEFRGILNDALDLLIKKKSSKWLGDTTNIMTLQKADEDWVNNEWFPKAIIGGVKKMAVVMPEKRIQNNVVNRIMDNNGKEVLQSCEFKSYQEAYDWISK